MDDGKRMTVPEHTLEENHANHANHLCALVARREMARVGELAKDAGYVCHICGRAAAKAENLCEPVEL